VSEVSKESFYRLWEPRIGRKAAETLSKRGWMAAFPVAMLVAIIWMAGTVSGSAYYATTLLVVVVGSTCYAVGLYRMNRRLASELTAHLGFEVSPKRLPPFRKAARFDSWLQATRSGTPRRERSFLGGFIKISQPPK
jgi:hypothetical protein